MLINPPVSSSIMLLLVFELCPAAFYTAHTEQPQTRWSPTGVSPKMNHGRSTVCSGSDQKFLVGHMKMETNVLFCAFIPSPFHLKWFSFSSSPLPLFLCITARAPSLPLNTCVTEHFSSDVMQAGMSVPCTLRVHLLVGHLPSVPLQGLRLKTDPTDVT